MSATETQDWLRPSMLPKLALCGLYRAEADAGEAAARGTDLDFKFRDLIAGNAVVIPMGEDGESLQWAIDTARALAGGLYLEAAESQLKIECLGMRGTADLLCEEGQWSADLKTGQKRNYLEQQAAYAWGFMERYFVDEWTVYLLFCDAREVETLRFTRESAEVAVRSALANAHDEFQPTINEYCGWCASRFTCSARREAVQIALKGNAPDFDSATGEQLRDFALRAKVVEEYAEEARERLKAKCIAGEKIAGVSLTSKRGARKVPARVIELHWKSLGTADILAAYGPMSEAKVLEIWKRKMPDTEFPADQVEEMPGSSYVTIRQPKAAK